MGFIANRVLGVLFVGTAIALAIFFAVGVPLNFIM